jgi:4-hydroxy-tetrahydrodipicolinate reductase
MDIALIGYGKMGKALEAEAKKRGDTVVCILTSPLDDWSQLTTAEVALDFSHPSAVLSHVEQCVRFNTPLVIGTTGWDHPLKELASSIGILYAPNFSIGVYLFLKLIRYSGTLFDPFPEYVGAGIEIHHAGKKDAPSGTAKAMQAALGTEVPMSSVRLGSITGKHSLLFDSPSDTITLSHEAKNREGFALGALQAAHWLIGKQGYYTLDDMMEETTHAL